jgi:anti-anti-sigma factor
MEDSVFITKLKELRIHHKIPLLLMMDNADQDNFGDTGLLFADALINKSFLPKDVLESVNKIIGASAAPEFSILVISPDKIFVEETEAFFNNNNYKVTSCSDPILGYELYIKKQPDLIISEMIFPGSGDSYLLDLKKITANENTPVILIGSGAEMKDFRIALNSGASDYFSKPVNYFSLLTSCELRIQKKKETKKKELQPANYFQEDLRNENILKKILLIEDNIALAESISIELEMLGYNIFTANTGLKGVQLADELQPDLIICDIMMPRNDGYFVLNSLRENTGTSHIPFVFLSAKSAYSDLRKGMNLGADDYITKPIKLSELDDIIRRKLKIPVHQKSSNPSPVKKKIASELLITNPEIEVSDFIPISSERKEIKKCFPDKIYDAVQSKKEFDEVLVEENPGEYKTDEENIRNAELDIFLSNKKDVKDYECMLFRDISVIKVNLNRAVEKEVRDFYKYLFTIIENGTRQILIDVRTVEYFSSSFLGVLISALKRITFLHGDIRLLMDLTNRSSDMIFLEGILRVFQIYEDHYVALNSMLYKEKV